MATIYILYSEEIDRYYVGSCLDLDTRIKEHNTGKYHKSFTKRSNDWRVVFSKEGLSQEQSRKIETHIKRMKSRKYINDLITYPEIITKLMAKYS